MPRRAGALRRAAPAMIGAALAAVSTTAASACKMALVLAHDVSSSVSAAEYALQTAGHAAAFREPDIQSEILLMGEIRVMLMHWAGAAYQDRLTPWRRLSSLKEIEAFAAELAAAPRRVTVGSTAIGEMLASLEDVWGGEAAGCERRAVDISGDGGSNSGRDIGPPRARLIARGVTINAVVIVTDEVKRPPPLPHYRRRVIGGPGAFAIKAEGFEDYRRAFRVKLIRELRGPAIARRAAPLPAFSGGG